MKIKTAVGTALLGAMLLCSPAFGDEMKSKAATNIAATGQSMAIEYGKSSPPVGYVQFCARGQDECRSKGGKVERLTLSAERWDQFNQVNNYVNSKIKPVSDQDLYGVPDYWTYPVSEGDCEDYVLLKKRYLIELGFAADELPITVVFDEHGEGHAILSALTDQGDYILDNRRNEILLWNETNYKFLKRQSQLDPTLWVSLQKNTPQVLVSSKSQ